MNIEPRKAIHEKQRANPQIPRYAVIPHTRYSVVEFISGKSRPIGVGDTRDEADKIAASLAWSSQGFAMGCEGSQMAVDYSDMHPSINPVEDEPDDLGDAENPAS